MASRAALLDRLRAVLVCPNGHGPLLDEPERLVCPSCGALVRRTPRHFDTGGYHDSAEPSEWLDRIKGRAKRRLGRFYPLAIRALSPVHGDMRVEPFLASFDLDRQLVCDLGAGTSSYDDRVVCIDGAAYDTVHLVTDLTRLPLADASLDGVMSLAVLEHVPDPPVHVAEMLRVLKPGGRLLCFFPFIQGFHASPHDYGRLTQPGLRRLFGGCQIEEIFVAGGPTSGMLWTLQEWLALAGSFGSERLYRALVPLTWALSPLKYLDVFLIKHPAAHVIASGFTIVARKPS